MFDAEHARFFEKWLSEFHSLAANKCCEWMISSDLDYHRKAFEDGVSPIEEYERLQKISADSGCGCSS
jgi:hypothetical protein